MNKQLTNHGQMIVVEKGLSEREKSAYLKVHRVIVPKQTKGKIK